MLGKSKYIYYIYYVIRDERYETRISKNEW